VRVEDPVELRDELAAQIPREEAGLVHRSVGESPQPVPRILDEGSRRNYRVRSLDPLVTDRTRMIKAMREPA
jgi:hypothetical protein